MRLPARLTGLVLATCLALAGCSGDAETPEAGEDSSQPTESAEPYLEVPDGVELTPQGSTLGVGETATVAYEPRDDDVAALDIKVTSLEKADFDLFTGWELSKETRKTAPYFVRAKVTNVGDSDLVGRPEPLPVPLYMVDDENRLIESSVFTGTFKPCDGARFPKKFRSGDTWQACMVYLAPGKGQLTAVSFRPTQEFNPIVWEGELQPAKGTEQGKKDKKKQND